jgi:hypothetical protein
MTYRLHVSETMYLFLVYLTTLSVAGTVQRRMTDSINELVRLQKEVIVAWFKVVLLSRYLLEGTDENHERRVTVAEHLPSTREVRKPLRRDCSNGDSSRLLASYYCDPLRKQEQSGCRSPPAGISTQWRSSLSEVYRDFIQYIRFAWLVP